MNVCGVVVHAHPDKLAEVRLGLDALDGVEVHLEAPNGRLVATVEDGPSWNCADALAAVHTVKGVIAAALISHEFSPDEQNN